MKDLYVSLAHEVYNEALGLFDKDVSGLKEYHNPYGAEFDIKLITSFKHIDLSFHLEHIVMYIDDYVWEFDDDITKARKVITEYMHAAHDNRLKETGFKIGSIILFKKIIVKGS